MRSLISSSKAQLVMRVLEENMTQNQDFPMTFFKRYVDKYTTALPNDKIYLLNAFNSFHTKL